MNPIRIAVIGAGYVGITTSVAFAEAGHQVIVIDRDASKIQQLEQAILPFYEKGVDQLLQKHQKSGSLTFGTDIHEGIKMADISFITVGTPSGQNGVADLSFVKEVARQIGKQINDYKIIVIKSTVPIGTGEFVRRIIEEELNKRKRKLSFDVVSNPEFLREGSALHDALKPERIIIGCETHEAKKMMEQLYQDTPGTLIFTTIKNAEMIKYASNAFLATKISFINEMARLCDKLGVDVTQVAKGMGLDSRIGPHFLNAGIGYGGSCFPKDVKAILAMGNACDVSLSILQAVSQVNETQWEWFMKKAKDKLGDFSNKRIAILGLTFKPDTDDIREAVSLKIIDDLVKNHAKVKAYDPKGIKHVQKLFPTVQFTSNPSQALERADAVFIVTEWEDIVHLDWKKAKERLATPYIFDGRNALNPELMMALGYEYVGVANVNK